jgi:hypothetical protein
MGAAILAPTVLTDAPFVFDDESAMMEPSFDAEPALSRAEPVLVRLAVAWIVLAAAVTVVELETVGRMPPGLAAVDVVSAFLLPFVLLWWVIPFLQPGEEPPGGSDDDDGGGRPPDGPDPVPPSGGLDIDWERFEADVHAYAQSREMVA